MTKHLTFAHFRKANVTRCLKWHPQGINSWSGADWFAALLGEMGELASLVKMANRERDNLPGNKFTPTTVDMGKEAADVVTYLDLLCASYGVDLCRSEKSFADLRKRNQSMVSRLGLPNIEGWSSSTYLVYMTQELGHMGAAIHPIVNWQGFPAHAHHFLCYLDLFCDRYNIDLEQAVVQKFNEISERVGFPDRITLD